MTADSWSRLLGCAGVTPSCCKSTRVQAAEGAGFVGAAHGTCDVATVAAAAGCRPTVGSQHLSKLRLAGLVQGTRDGRQVFCQLCGGHVRSLLQ